MIAYILPVLVILALGSFLNQLMGEFQDLSYLHRIINIITLGTSGFFIPVVLISFVTAGLIDEVLYTLYALSLAIMVKYIFVDMHKITLHTIRKYWKQFKSSIKITHGIFVLLILDYTFLNFLYPVRGWDALQFYVPNAEYIYTVDDIPTKVNPTSFFPTAKPPLNTLMIVLPQYMNGKFSAQLLPILYLVGCSLIAIEFTKDLVPSIDPYFSAIMFFTLPTTYVYLLEYIYYQDLLVALFISAAFLNIWKYKQYNDVSLLFIASLGLSLGVLSKISGYVGLLIILMSFGIVSKKVDRWFKVSLSILLSIFLVYKSTSSQFIGFTIIIIFLAVFYVWNIWDSNQNFLNYKELLIIAILPISTSFLWGIHISHFPEFTEILINTYFSTSDPNLVFNYSRFSFISTIYMENAHAANFFSASTVIFYGSHFVPFYLVFKLRGIISLKKSHSFMLSWLIVFYQLWMTYHVTTSIRYLSVIWIPLMMITIRGIDDIISWILDSKMFDSSIISQKNAIILLIIGCSFLFYYPFIPFSGSELPFHRRFYYYHNSILLNISYLMVFMVGLKVWIHRLPQLGKDRLKYINLVLAGIIIIAPIATQTTIFMQNDLNVKQTQSDLAYDNRESVRYLANFVNEYMDIDNIAIGVNIPGLGYFADRSFIDFYFAVEYIDLPSNFTESNITSQIDYLNERGISLVIILTQKHAYYQPFISRYVTNYSVFNSSLHNPENRVYSNSEFLVFSI